MRALPTELRDRLASGVTTLAHAWRVTRADGAVFGFTDHDRDIVMEGLTCAASTALAAGALEKALGDGDAVRAEGAFAADAITPDDLARGLWDGARVELWRVDWRTPALRTLMHTGRFGAVDRTGASFAVELEGLDAALDRAMGRVFARACDAEVGDARCGVNLDAPAFRGEGVVTQVLDARTLRVAGLAAFADGWFSGGMAVAESGWRSEATAHRKSGDADVLELRAPAPVAPGESFVVTAGCDKQFATCRAKFGNGLNFRGCPHMPGNDALIAGPDARFPMDGASRSAGA